MVDNFFNENGIRFLKDESLKKHTTFKVGGNASYIAFPDEIEKLSLLIKFTKQNNIKTYYLGNGSNTIFRDEGFDGIIIKSDRLNSFVVADNLAYIESGNLMTKTARQLGEMGLSGLECCYGIPGNIGGGLFMNAGAYGGEISSHLVDVDFLDENGELRRLSKEECMYSYRHSVFMEHKWFIIGARFEFEYKDSNDLLAYMDDIMSRRKEKQPLDKPSAGSSFKRPAGYFAAALIDECGLKGATVGGAQVSQKHAGFIVNTGNATCQDIISLADYVSEEVCRQKGVKIEKEMIIV